MEKEANIIKLLVSFNNLQNSIIIEDKNYHIYVINSEKIKEGESCWAINKNRDTVYFIENAQRKENELEGINFNWNKVIATTDSSLTIDREVTGVGWAASTYKAKQILLPRLSDDFIKAYVKAQGKVDKVLVEYYNLNGQESGQLIKIASYNTITIKPFEEKTSWSREEVIELLHKRMRFTFGLDYNESTTNDWIKENL